MAVDLVTQVVSDLPQWIQGFEETAGRETSVQWDPESQVWVLTGAEDYDETDASGHVTFQTTVQFLAAGEPMQHPNETTDQIEMTQQATNTGIYDPGSFQVEFALEANHELSIVANGEQGGDITGQGSITGTTETTVNGRTYDGRPNLGWTVALTFNETAECGAGTISGGDGDYEFAATLDGTGQVAFAVTKNGRTIDSEPKDYECPNFGGEEASQTAVKLQVIGLEAAEQASHLMSESARWFAGDLGPTTSRPRIESGTGSSRSASSRSGEGPSSFPTRRPRR
jgi:hypothetical protein